MRSSSFLIRSSSAFQASSKALSRFSSSTKSIPNSSLNVSVFEKRSMNSLKPSRFKATKIEPEISSMRSNAFVIRRPFSIQFLSSKIYMIKFENSKGFKYSKLSSFLKMSTILSKILMMSVLTVCTELFSKTFRRISNPRMLKSFKSDSSKDSFKS